MRSRRDQLLEHLAEEEGRLVAPEREYQAMRARVTRLRERLAGEEDSASDAAPQLGEAGTPNRSDGLAAVGAASPPAGDRHVPPDASPPAPPRTAHEKVQLFRSLFRGRVEVFPTRFVSSKTGKAGYAPACANKFVRGLCQLPRVKCGACPNQAFLPVTDEAVLDHLRGRRLRGYRAIGFTVRAQALAAASAAEGRTIVYDSEVPSTFD